MGGAVAAAEHGAEAGVAGDRDVHPVGALQHVEQLAVELFDDRLVAGAEDQVPRLQRVGLQVIELIDVPKAVVADIFVLLPPHRVDRRRHGEVPLPVVFVEQGLAPRNDLALGQRQGVRPGQPLGRGEAGGGQQGRRHVDIGHHLVHDGSLGEQLWAARKHRDADRFLIGRALVDQPVFAEGKAVVAHVEDQRRVQQAAPFQMAHHAAGALVHRQQGLGVAAVVFGDIDRGMVRKINAVPAITHILDPHGPGARFGGRSHGRGIGERGARIAALVARRRDVVGVHRLVRQEQHEGLVALARFQPGHGIVGQLVGDVSVLRHMFAVDVQPVGTGQIAPLALEADPMIKPRLRIIALRPHVPLADERSLIAGALQILWKEGQSRVDGVVVVHHPVLVRIEAGEDRGAGG